MSRIKNYIANNYKSFHPIIIRSNDSSFFDNKNKEYIDGTSSYCSANLGHNNNYLKSLMIEQLNKNSICPRYLYNKPLCKLSVLIHNIMKDLINHKGIIQSLPSCNGVDAVETAIKLSRAWGYEKKYIPIGKSIQVFMKGNFHGRTTSVISVSDDDYQTKFYPKMGNMKICTNENLEDFVHYNNENITSIFVEPVQCEGGIKISNMSLIRKLCDKYNILLVSDEIQTGLFRTGSFLCSQNFNVKPDIVLLGKSLGGGFLPFSLTICSKDIMECILPNEHGSTFGGYPLGAKMAEEVIKLLYKEKYNKSIPILELEYTKNLEILRNKYKFIKDIRNMGFLFGIELDHIISSELVCNKLINHGLIIKSTKFNTLRLCPPFIITNKETEKIFNALDTCFNTI